MTPISRSQLQSQLRQAAARRQQAIRDLNTKINAYNNAVSQYNANRRRAIDDYNRRARAYNSQVRLNRERLNRELSRLAAGSRTTRYVTYRTSVTSMTESFSRIEQSANAGNWTPGADVFHLVEGEAASGVSVLNTLNGNSTAAVPSLGELKRTEIEAELRSLSVDLVHRWTGALFALSPENPDAARHFCTSAREILTTIVDLAAPDDVVPSNDVLFRRTEDGRASRRARLHYRLEAKGILHSELEAFVEHDVESVLALFRDFNDGTHGSAGAFDLAELGSIKGRVEDAVKFLHQLIA